MIRTRTLALAISFLAVVVPASGQEDDVRQAESPFQEGFDYTVGDDLDPRVEVDGLRWTRVAVSPRGDREIVEGEEVPVFVHLNFENRSEYSREATVILLFEDNLGRPLQRLPCDNVRVGGGRTKEDRQKLKVDGDVLLATTHLYLYCEVE